MALMKTVKDMNAFKEAYALAVEIRPITQAMPKTEQFGGIADQMRRASTGICANLAEGFAKNQSKLEFRRYVLMALGSSGEMDLWLTFAQDFGYITRLESEKFRQRYANISKMLRGLEQKLVPAKHA